MPTIINVSDLIDEIQSQLFYDIVEYVDPLEFPEDREYVIEIER